MKILLIMINTDVELIIDFYYKKIVAINATKFILKVYKNGYISI